MPGAFPPLKADVRALAATAAGRRYLALVVIRVAIRVTHGAPPLPDDLPGWQRAGAKASHYALYAMMVAMPLIGWSMLSAGGYPVVLAPGVQLRPIAPHNVTLYAWLRAAHTWVALALYATVLLHFAAALFHALIRRDGVFASMARGRSRAWRSPSRSIQAARRAIPTTRSPPRRARRSSRARTSTCVTA